jgi:general secretion pathway protein B
MRTSGGSLPDLRLSLHVYDADPSQRYMLLNGMRLREGDVMPDGLRVERITEDGAVMGWRGRRFLLPRGE